MRMKWGSRLGITLYLLAMLAALIGVLVFALNLMPQEYLANALTYLFYDTLTQMIAGVVVLVLLALTILMLVALWRRPRAQTALITTTENGTVRMTVAALDVLVQAVLKQFPAVVENKSDIRVGETGISVYARICFKEGVLVKEISEQIQQAIKKEIEDSTGIVVTAVQLFVDKRTTASVKTSNAATLG